ncbi:phosphoribosylanthranilate isomerase [Thiovibrio frasassiensis]|uniref:N-(5'-phosphoribosyl)anthranilate isomerase n=1 Tax=Thiovibrio frasassiensis TaxID=2984131 RepID=A0A9X4MDJ8_9BACT|nr:phosphoribosylanthranilate isomerase [Thiovibrio frasassiensis]MDG4474597.1 phosphoribosylanthranilate isomerase [Thiovibrio frasassiensis]
MNARTRIKVCGMREVAEVAAVVEAGVDAIGMIFVEQSPRYVEPERARDIVASLPPFVDAVGVFLDQDVATVNEIVRSCGLTMVQLHGEESPAYCAEINCRVIKVFRVRPTLSTEDLAPYAGVVSGFLFDTFHEKIAGGTGDTFDWHLLEKLSPPRPIILAGGLTPENVGEAIRQAHPFAVDLNSGVEISPGRKDLVKVRAAIAQVAAADGAYRQG